MRSTDEGFGIEFFRDRSFSKVVIKKREFDAK